MKSCQELEEATELCYADELVILGRGKFHEVLSELIERAAPAVC